MSNRVTNIHTPGYSGCNIVVVHLLSCVQLFVTPWTVAHQASLSFTISQSLLKLMSIESVMSSNHLILCCPFLLLPSIFPSIRVFFNESVFAPGGQSIGASASVLPMNLQGWFPLELTGLVSLLSTGLLRIFSGTTVWKHHFFGTQPSLWSNSHLYMTTRKTIALTIRTFVDKVISLLFNMLYSFIIDFLLKSSIF